LPVRVSAALEQPFWALIEPYFEPYLLSHAQRVASSTCKKILFEDSSGQLLRQKTALASQVLRPRHTHAP
jgi:hypothetical protein